MTPSLVRHQIEKDDPTDSGDIVLGLNAPYYMVGFMGRVELKSKEVAAPS